MTLLEFEVQRCGVRDYDDTSADNQVVISMEVTLALMLESRASVPWARQPDSHAGTR